MQPDTSPPQKTADTPQGVSPDAGTDEIAKAQRIAKLDALGASLAQKRSDAIASRQASGIEEQWLEDEEFYQGVDDANRNEHSNAWRTKPPGQYRAEAKSSTRSTVFPNITRPYCDAGAARFADMVLPTDDRNYSIGPTPIPELAGLAKGEIPPGIQRTAAQAQDQAGVNAIMQDAVQQAIVIIDEAKKKAEKAQKRIEDWHIECQYHAEVRKTIEDAARIGSGVLKGPIPRRVRTVAFKEGKVIIDTAIKPASKSIDPWNFYPDGGCGDNIQNGGFTWERDYLTPKKLQDLRDQEGYIASQIDMCIKEGPTKAVASAKEKPNHYSDPAKESRFEVWHCYTVITKDDFTAMGCKCDEDPDKPHPLIPAMIIMVNDRVIKGALNPMDTGDFPYDVFPWQKKDGLPWGNGIGRQGRTPQRITTAAVRNMMDNGGLSAGCQIVLKQGLITPADGSWDITPRKVWLAGEDAEIDDVAKAIHFFEIPSRQEELMQIVTFGMKLMEDSTGLPMLLQGQQGTAPDTVGGMQMLNNNASSVLRRLARTFDDKLTEPHIRRYYTYLLQYGEDDEKGDFQIDARGSSALVERDLQSNEIGQMANLTQNPIYKIDPTKWATEFLKSKKFDPKNFQFDDDKWEKIVQGMAQKPADPRVQVAKMQIDSKAAEGDKDRKVDLLLAQVNERIAEIKETGAKEISFEELKAMLADTAMKLSTQREISAATIGSDLHKHHNPPPPPPVLVPPTEPAGRAAAGQAYAA